MAAPMRFSLGKLRKSKNHIVNSLQLNFADQDNCLLSLQQFLYQQRVFSYTSHYFQTTHTEGLPGYNYGLPGKGKSRLSTRHKWTPDVTGELLFGLHPVYLALKAKRRKAFHCLHINEKYGNRFKKVHPMLNQIFHLATEIGIVIKFVRKHDLDIMSGNRPHQGVCLDAEELTPLIWDEGVTPDWHSESGDLPLWLFLHKIQDPMNFGAILRSSYFMGIHKVIVPKDNSCKLSPVVSKASSGVLEVIDLLKLPQHTTDEAFYQWWKCHGGMILGTDTSTKNPVKDEANCVALQDFTLSKPSLLVLGNEGTGINDATAKLCDVRLHIESCQIGYHKEIDSLNVSVATGILLHWLQMSKLKSLS